MCWIKDANSHSDQYPVWSITLCVCKRIPSNSNLRLCLLQKGFGAPSFLCRRFFFTYEGGLDIYFYRQIRMNEARFWVSLNQAPPMLLLLCPTSFPFKVTQSALIFFSNFDDGHFKENHIQFFWRNSSDIWGRSAQKRGRGRRSNVKGVQIEVKARHSS